MVPSGRDARAQDVAGRGGAAQDKERCDAFSGAERAAAYALDGGAGGLRREPYRAGDGGVTGERMGERGAVAGRGSRGRGNST